MSILILLAFGVGSLTAIWAAQSLLLVLKGHAIRPPLCLRDAPPAVRWPMKLVVQIVLLGILTGFPLAVGQHPIAYHREKLIPARPWELLELFLLTLACFLLGTAIETRAGWVKLAPRYGLLKSSRKVVQGFLTPLPLACVEEGLFRGVLLDETLRALPSGLFGTCVAVAFSAAVFSTVHFIRPARNYEPAFGLFVLGCLLGTAYLAGARTYWLPVGLHAGGILAIQLLRPFVEYRGPAWIIGYRSYPVAGAMGIGIMFLLGAYCILGFGGSL